MAGTLNEKLKTAPCQGACPAGVDVPRYIRYIRAGKFEQALGVVRESLPFPGVCGYACFHPCEGACARRQYEQAVSIRMLKRAAVDFGGDSRVKLPMPAPTGKAAAVIGAGPAGLTAAYYLANKGHQVTVFEQRAEPGGLMRYGIPEYRLPNSIVDRDIALIRSRGVEIKSNTEVQSPADLLNQGFAAVCVAAGAWGSVKIQLPGEGLEVVDGLTFLSKANSGELASCGEKVAVVGGGNTAIDAARTALRLGAKEVTLVYRRTQAEMPANPEEIAEAQLEGVKFEFLAAPVKTGKQELTCSRMALGEPDSSGRPQAIPLAASEFSLPCDQVILAVGQVAGAAALGLPANSNGTAQVNALAAGVPGVYAAGDIVKGPASVIEAVADGRRAASAIDQLLGGDGDISETWVTEAEDQAEQTHIRGEIKLAAKQVAVATSTDNDAPHALTPEIGVSEAGDQDFAPPGQSRPEVSPIPLSERVGSFRLAEQGYNQKTAEAEASRCLGCDINAYEVEVEEALCKDCSYCREVCGQGVFEQAEFFNSQGYRPMVAAAKDRCVGCLKCLMICPDFAITVARRC